jgi:hypothetical protein
VSSDVIPSGTDKKKSLDNGITHLFLGLLNNIEVMPMLMGSEMALKTNEMENNSIFGVPVCLILHLSFPSFLQSFHGTVVAVVIVNTA